MNKNPPHAQHAVVPAVIDKNRRYDIRTASALLAQSRSKTYNDITAGLLAVIKDGTRSYIHGSELIRRSRPTAASR